MDLATMYFINGEYEKFEKQLDKTENQARVLFICTDIACNSGDYNKMEILFNMANKLRHRIKNEFLIEYNPVILNLIVWGRCSSFMWLNYRMKEISGKNPLIFAHENNNIEAIKCIIMFCNKYNINIAKIVSGIVSECIHNRNYSILQLLINNLVNDYKNYSETERYGIYVTPNYCYYEYCKNRIKIELIVHNIMAQQIFHRAKMIEMIPLMYLLIRASNKAKKKIPLNYGANMIYFLQTNNKIFI